MARRKQRSGGKRPGPAPEVPQQFLASISALIGVELIPFKQALEQPAPVSIRLNPWKGFDPGGAQVPWCPVGRYLEQRPAFTFDPLLHTGAYYVQEASSMFLQQALEASGAMQQDILALDLCAAPGGKTTHLGSLLTPGSLLVANEIDRQRQTALQENLWKWGRSNVMVTGSAPQDLAGLPELFDLILVDAPCSGEGMFRKDPFAREQWSPELVRQCATVQSGIVQHAWQALAPGGILIYSTCTWEPAENELQLRPLLDEGGEPIDIPLKKEWNVQRSEMEGAIGYRFYPHRTVGEGFFLSMVRKPGTSISRIHRPNASAESSHLEFLRAPESLHLVEMNGIQHALDDTWASTAQQIRSVLRTLAPGIPVAERKGAEWRPHPALALNQLLDTSELTRIELSLSQALEYLRGQALPAVGDRGPALATYAGRPLGWLQGAGNRWNNRWPAHWRIRAHEALAGQVSWNPPLSI